jgi:hypothetical protein
MPKRRQSPQKPSSAPRMTEEQVRQIVAKMIETNARAALEHGPEPSGTAINQSAQLSGGIKAEPASGAQHCQVSGCVVVRGETYAGTPACLQGWAGDPESHARHLTKCLLRQQQNSTVCRSPAADTGPSLQGDNSSGPPPSDSREATPRVEAKVPANPLPSAADLEAHIARRSDPKAMLLAFAARTGQTISPEEADEILDDGNTASAPGPARDPEPRFTDAVPQMTDGDLGITKAWAHQAPQKPVVIRDIVYRTIAAKPSPVRWLADLGQVLRWGAALVALAFLLVTAWDYGSAREAPPQPSVVTFNLRY